MIDILLSIGVIIGGVDLIGGAIASTVCKATGRATRSSTRPINLDKPPT